MRILLDENLDVRLKELLDLFDVLTVKDMGWLGKKNGELLRLIREHNFDLFISADKNLPYQQNTANLPAALWIFDAPDASFSTTKSFMEEVVVQLRAIGDQPLDKSCAI